MIEVHTDNKETLYNALNRIAELESKIADIKANCDYVLEGKEVEYREERKKLCDEFENMKTGLESQIAELKDHLAEEVELHLHAEDYIKSLEQQIEKMKCCGNCRGVCNSDDVACFCKNNNFKLWEIKENEL